MEKRADQSIIESGYKTRKWDIHLTATFERERDGGERARGEPLYSRAC